MDVYEFRKKAIELIRSHKHRNRLTLQKFADIASTDASTVHIALSGKRNLKLETQIKWLTAIGYDVELIIKPQKSVYKSEDHGVCEIRWCQRKAKKIIPVDEIIGDAAYRVKICQNCAIKIGVFPGDVLPEPHLVRKAVKLVQDVSVAEGD